MHRTPHIRWPADGQMVQKSKEEVMRSTKAIETRQKLLYVLYFGSILVIGEAFTACYRLALYEYNWTNWTFKAITFARLYLISVVVGLLISVPGMVSTYVVMNSRKIARYRPTLFNIVIAVFGKYFGYVMFSLVMPGWYTLAIGGRRDEFSNWLIIGGIQFITALIVTKLGLYQRILRITELRQNSSRSE